MSPRRRTLCFVLLLLSFNNGLVDSSPVGPVLTEYYPSPGSCPQQVNPLLTVTPGNRVLPDASQKVFSTQRFNELFAYGSYPPGSPINAVVPSSYGVPKPNSFTTYSSFLSPAETVNVLPVVDTITETLAYPSNVESLTIVENYPSVTQNVQVEGYAPTANVADIYQTPINVQIPSMPQFSPFAGIATPLSEILPSRNVIQEIYTPNVVSEICPQTFETGIATVTSVPIETTSLSIPSCDLGCGSQQLPVTLQINMASPLVPEPVIAIIPQPAPAPSPCSSFNPSIAMPPAPIIVMEKSKSKWKTILPILMLTLFDGGCGNNGGGGCSCSPSMPVPFPIVIPTNNPVITRGKGKSKASTDVQS